MGDETAQGLATLKGKPMGDVIRLHRKTALPGLVRREYPLSCGRVATTFFNPLDAHFGDCERRFQAGSQTLVWLPAHLGRCLLPLPWIF
jgi:hypothetical protein